MVKREVFRYGHSASWHPIRIEAKGIPYNLHYHPEYELTLTLKSSGTRQIGDHISEYKSPDLVLISPNYPHSWRSMNDMEESERFIILLPEYWLKNQLDMGLLEYKDAYHLLESAKPAIAFSDSCSVQCERLFRIIFENDSSLLRLNILNEIFSNLLNDKDARHIPLNHSTMPSRGRIEKAIAYLHDNLSKDIEIMDVASHVHCSISTLKRDFYTISELSFGQYLLKLRIESACRQLITTDMPLDIIAYRCGFQSMRTFHRCFQRQLQETPASFRKRMKAIT